MNDDSHAFYAFRHFPELRTSLTEAINTSKANPKPRTKIQIRRDIPPKSIHKLENLEKSSYQEFNAMNNFRKALIEGRSQQKNMLTLVRTPQPSTLSPIPEIITPENAFEQICKKISKISKTFDTTSEFNVMKQLEDIFLTKDELDGQLRRGFNLTAHPLELNALYNHFPLDPDTGCVKGLDFVRFFFRQGSTERSKSHHSNMRVLENKQSEEKKLIETRNEKSEEFSLFLLCPPSLLSFSLSLDKYRLKFVDLHISSTSFSSEDYTQGMNRLVEACLRVTRGATLALASPAAQGFDSMLTTYEFKLQIEKSFQVKLMKPEFGAVVDRFSLPRSSSSDPILIDGRAFLMQFFILQKSHLEEQERRREEGSQRRRALDQALGPVPDNYPKSLGR